MKSIRSSNKEGEIKDFTYELCETQSTRELKSELDIITGMTCQQRIYKSEEWLPNFPFSELSF